jgi:ribosomal-protein-alanine N-acetyltransferase
MRMPLLETRRLTIRPFSLDDLDDIHRILDSELHFVQSETTPPTAREERAAWLQWSIAGYERLALLYQPPFGDRAVILKETGALIGACGYSPTLAPFGQLDGFPETPYYTFEVGLFYAFARSAWGQGFATEAAQSLVDYGFDELQLARIVATTQYSNSRSAAVMQRLGMRIERNPRPDPPWLQIVGVLDHPRIAQREAPPTPLFP